MTTVDHTHRTCTVKFATAPYVCGRPAVYAFTSDIAEGEVFAECAEHVEKPVESIGTGIGMRVGDKVEVHRYGKTYVATVVYVGARGRVEAEFTYGNGAVRRVAV